MNQKKIKTHRGYDRSRRSCCFFFDTEREEDVKLKGITIRIEHRAFFCSFVSLRFLCCMFLFVFFTPYSSRRKLTVACLSLLWFFN